MSFFTLTTEQSTVNYDETFSFSLNISFNGLSGPLSPVRLFLFFPDSISYRLPSVSPPVESITVTSQTDGDQVLFDFGTVTNTGIAANMQIDCRFKTTTSSGTDFSLSGALYITSLTEPYLTASSSPVTLTILPDYQVTTSIVIPETQDSAPSGYVVYEVSLENLGDQWPSARQFVFEVDLSDSLYLTLDPSLSILGSDNSTLTAYADTSSDGIAADLASFENGFSLTLPAYRGQRYHFYFRAGIAGDVSPQTSILLTTSWSIDGQTQNDVTTLLPIVSENASGQNTLSGPNQVQPGNYMLFQNSISNTGNTSLQDAVLTWSVNTENIEPFRLTTGSFKIMPIEVPLEGEYLLTYSPAETPLTEYPLTSSISDNGYYPLSSSYQLTLSETSAASSSIAYFHWHLGDLPIGTDSVVAPRIEGYAANALLLGTSIATASILSFLSPDGSTQNVDSYISISVSSLSELLITTHTVSPDSRVIPGDLLTVTTTINTWYSQLNDPVYLCLLSDKVSFVKSTPHLVDSFYMEYYNPLLQVTVNTLSDPGAFPLPAAELVLNYNESGYALIRLSFHGSSSYSFLQAGLLKVSFQVRVNIGARGNFELVAYLGNYGPYGAVSHALSRYTEASGEDIDQDRVYTELLAKSLPATVTIEDYASIQILKKSKGSLDDGFVDTPLQSSSYDGGLVTYQLSIQNTGNMDIRSLELIDILPHPGDTGVLETGILRGSDFAVYPVTHINAVLYDSNLTVLPPDSPIVLQYSRSYDPVRFGNAGTSIGTVNDWSASLPVPITELKSFRLLLSSVLKPGQMLVITGVYAIPVQIASGMTAWNSYSVSCFYADSYGALHKMLPVESEKAGVTIADTQNYGRISGFTWLDSEGTGIYTEDMEGLNDIGIILYKVTGTTAHSIDSTITVSNSSGQRGHFSFLIKEGGEYLLRFAPNLRYYSYSPQNATLPNGSLADSATGLTGIISLASGETRANIISGFINYRTASFITEINDQANRTLRNSIYSQLVLNMKLENTLSLLTDL